MSIVDDAISDIVSQSQIGERLVSDWDVEL